MLDRTADVGGFSKNINGEAAPGLEEQWVARIRPHLETGVAGYIAAGREMIEAKRALKKQRGASFTRMVEKLGENIDAVQKWMAIARNPFFAETANLRFLPTAWTTLYVLCPLAPAVLEERIETGWLHPALTGEEATALVRLINGRGGRRRDEGSDHDPDHGDPRKGDHGDQHEVDHGDRREGDHDDDLPARIDGPPDQGTDVGPDSRSEIERKLARAEELERQARQWEIQRGGWESEIAELKAKLDETPIRHQRRLFRQMLGAMEKAETANLPDKEKRSLHYSAVIDLTELVRSLARDGIAIGRLDLFCRPELH